MLQVSVKATRLWGCSSMKTHSFSFGSNRVALEEVVTSWWLPFVSSLQGPQVGYTPAGSSKPAARFDTWTSEETSWKQMFETQKVTSVRMSCACESAWKRHIPQILWNINLEKKMKCRCQFVHTGFASHVKDIWGCKRTLTKIKYQYSFHKVKKGNFPKYLFLKSCLGTTTNVWLQ